VEVAVSWKVVRSTETNQVSAVFEGHLNTADGVASAAEFRQAFQGPPLEVVWDVTALTGFDSGARSAWAEALWPVRSQFKSLEVVGAKGALIRVGATFLAVLLGAPYKFSERSQRVG
jgi:hypothetical protein